MRRLVQIILFTPDVESMRHFYEEGIGLYPVYAGPNWTSYRTAGVTLAIHPLGNLHRREIELTFDSPDARREVESFRTWGVHPVGEIQDQTYGTTVQFRDPSGNLLALRSGGDRPGDAGPVIGSVIVNVQDLDEAVDFYRERLGLAPSYVSPHWVEFDAGGVRLAAHKRPAGLAHPLHAQQPIAFGFETLDLEAWVEEIRGRDVEFPTMPIEQDFGLYAEARDPDGNVIVFRETSPLGTLEDELAEPYDEDVPTHQVAFRKPVKKGARAVSRVALRPEYRQESTPARRRLSATTRRVTSMRGAGPERTRMRPKRTADERKTKVKPAVGRRGKAEMRSASLQRSARATSSKGRPVKRAAAGKGRQRSR
ncbi:MAG TPA: VOC family protein [Terriglobales bacterium]|nr:VOC family protein [Terriglobales bacterium]